MDFDVYENLSEQDRAQIWEWNQQVPESVESCVHEVVEQQVHDWPNSPAICSWDGDLSYGELDELSTRLAHYLVGLGVGPEVSVVLFFDKSKWAVVAMLGILKAGGACVSLNTTHPMARLECIIQDVRAVVILVSEAYSNRFDNIAKVVVVEQTLFHELAVDRSPVHTSIKPENLAFIVFTSGSTGRPKGIMLEHRSVCASARARGTAIGIDRESRVLQFAAYSFDVSLSDIFITLMRGGCVCVPSEYDRLHNLSTAINTMKVNQMQLTPTVAELLLPSEVPSLKVLSLGGELMKPGNIAVWAGNVQLHNVYGPSECTIDCAVNTEVQIGSNPAVIGQGMGALLWIVESSDYNRLAPLGSVGELLIEGPVVARGYLNEVEKTASAFVTNPAWMLQARSGQQRRMYRTGDLVRYTSNGLITFVGRKDTQVKLHGQRIELSEIEYHLTRDSTAIALSLVVLPKKGPYCGKLVAVFQLRKASRDLPSISDDIQIVSKTEIQAIRSDICQMCDSLKKHLPECLVPTVWICIKKIPLLASAKIDRKRVCSWLEGLALDELCIISENSVSIAHRISDDEPIAFAISLKIASLVASGNTELRTALERQDMILCLSGLDSITSITLMNFIRKTYHVTVGPERFFRSEMTVRGLAEHINNLWLGVSEETPKLDIMTEFRMVMDKLQSPSYCLCSSLSRPLLKIRNVFVTGTTGYLGTQILKALLADSRIDKIIAHVRGSTIEHATERLITSATSAGWWSDFFFKRLEVWAGDLRRPQLGLSRRQWARMNGSSPAHERVNAIIHNGAAVYWNADYNTLKSVNVDSTLDLLSAARMSPSLCKFIYLSGGHFRRNGVSSSNEIIAAQLSTSNGYSQTKFVSELLVEEASRRCRHCHFSILKPGIIIGTAQNGLANIDDFLWRLVAGAIQLRSYHDDEHADAWLYIADVERVVQTALVDLFDNANNGDGDSEGKVNGNSTASTHQSLTYTSLPDGLPLRAFWTLISEDLGYALRPEPHRESWLAALRADVESAGEQHPLWPVLPSLGHLYGSLGRRSPVEEEEEGKSDEGEKEERMEAEEAEGRDEERKRAYDSRTKRVKEAIRKNVEYLVQIGFLPNPDGEKRVRNEDRLEDGEEGEGKRTEVFSRSRNGWLPKDMVGSFKGTVEL